MDSHSWMLYISIVVFLSLSAFFSASETALSTYNKIRVKKRAQDGDSKAKALLYLTDNYSRTISAILVGNNLVNIATSTITALLFTAAFGAYGALVSAIVTTVLVLLLAEIMPKSYASAHSDSVALLFAKPLKGILTLLSPVTFAFSVLQDMFVRESAPAVRSPSITEEELLYFIESIEEEGVLEEQESNLVQSALEFDEITIREIFTPRVNVAALDVDSTQRELVQEILDAKYSRMPVFEGSVDNIIGILFVRDAMRCLVRGEELNVRDMMDEPYFVHKGMKLNRLLANFQSKKAHMAVVLDEYGGTLGIVTLVDLLEELVGDFDVNAREDPETLTRLEDGRFKISGGYGLWDMFEELGIDEDKQESGYNTVNGWALNIIGHIPGVGESFEAEGMRFSVLEMDGRRIKLLEAVPLQAESGGLPPGEDAVSY